MGRVWFLLRPLSLECGSFLYVPTWSFLSISNFLLLQPGSLGKAPPWGLHFKYIFQCCYLQTQSQYWCQAGWWPQFTDLRSYFQILKSNCEITIYVRDLLWLESTMWIHRSSWQPPTHSLHKWLKQSRTMPLALLIWLPIHGCHRSRSNSPWPACVITRPQWLAPTLSFAWSSLALLRGTGISSLPSGYNNYLKLGPRLLLTSERKAACECATDFSIYQMHSLGLGPTEKHSWEVRITVLPRRQGGLMWQSLSRIWNNITV